MLQTLLEHGISNLEKVSKGTAQRIVQIAQQMSVVQLENHLLELRAAVQLLHQQGYLSREQQTGQQRFAERHRWRYHAEIIPKWIEMVILINVQLDLLVKYGRYIQPLWESFNIRGSILSNFCLWDLWVAIFIGNMMIHQDFSDD